MKRKSENRWLGFLTKIKIKFGVKKKKSFWSTWKQAKGEIHKSHQRWSRWSLPLAAGVPRVGEGASPPPPARRRGGPQPAIAARPSLRHHAPAKVCCCCCLKAPTSRARKPTPVRVWPHWGQRKFQLHPTFQELLSLPQRTTPSPQLPPAPDAGQCAQPGASWRAREGPLRFCSV